MHSHDATRTHSLIPANMGIKSGTLQTSYQGEGQAPRTPEIHTTGHREKTRPTSESAGQGIVKDVFPQIPKFRSSPKSGHKNPSLPPPYLSLPRWTAAGRSSGRRRRRRCRFGSGRGDRARTRRAARLSRCSPASQPSSTGSREGQGGEKRRERGGEGGDRESLQRKSRPSPPTAPPGRRRRFWVSGNINLCLHRTKAKWEAGRADAPIPRDVFMLPPLPSLGEKRKKKKRESVKKSQATHTTSVLCNTVPSPPQSRKVAQSIASLQKSREGDESNILHPPPSPPSPPFLRIGLHVRHLTNFDRKVLSCLSDQSHRTRQKQNQASQFHFLVFYRNPSTTSFVFKREFNVYTASYMQVILHSTQ